MKLKTYIYSIALAGALFSLATSCDDMLDMGNDYAEYNPSINTPADSVTFVVGILNKLQAIAVRNNLFGEVRGDLVKVNSNATTDLKDLADFAADDDNAYNVPRDYYAVINNCNYYLANADSTAGNASRGEQYFVNEIAQVHSIRAWTYLQLVKAYGNVPYVTEPILTKLESEVTYPMKGISDLCTELIEDLQPYYATEYPDWQTVGGDIDPKLCFFPTQIVMGDLYLWRAVVTGSVDDAKSAAKCYYDYIVWDLSGKEETVNTNEHWYWDLSGSTTASSMLRNVSQYTSISSTWGDQSCTDITKIPMDSAAADGYYNELRNLYNTTYVTDVSQASISPSQYLIDLSAAQKYVGYDENNDTTVITSDRLSEELIERYATGDLRFQKDYTSMTARYGNSIEETDVQIINKHNSQHISIYNVPQLYLKLAEALNYAGYPRFAKQILVMGLSDNVIAAEVSPYYPTPQDSDFISYFQFNPNTFKPYAESYTQTTDDYGLVASTTPVPLNKYETTANMWGIHSRGCGLAFLDTDYAPALTPDSTDYPYALEAAIPEKPATVKQPSTSEAMDYDTWAATKHSPSEAAYQTYLSSFADSLANWQQYQAELEKRDEVVETFVEAYNTWYYNAYSDPTFIAKEQKQMDELILTEQALELAYQGSRYYDLMRRAYWWNDPTYLTGMQDKEGASKLSTPSNRFLQWDGQIGLYDEESEEEAAE
ncbi:MAG: RagB/SusD family nutrient uptake outer membrane protein [Prevotellaceae bacterium]|nr:RagB/SusD family nutrient uptake outer membrane protein [Prevotellaceae bacterium]